MPREVNALGDTIPEEYADQRGNGFFEAQLISRIYRERNAGE